MSRFSRNIKMQNFKIESNAIINFIRKCNILLVIFIKLSLIAIINTMLNDLMLFSFFN